MLIWEDMWEKPSGFLALILTFVVNEEDGVETTSDKFSETVAYW